MKDADEATDPLDGITVLTEPTTDPLNEGQQIDFRTTRENCSDGCSPSGKTPGKQTATRRHPSKRAPTAWTSSTAGSGNTKPMATLTDITHDHADAWLTHIAMTDHSTAHKANCRKALLLLYNWRHHEHGLEEGEASPFTAAC